MCAHITSLLRPIPDKVQGEVEFTHPTATPSLGFWKSRSCLLLSILLRVVILQPGPWACCLCTELSGSWCATHLQPSLPCLPSVPGTYTSSTFEKLTKHPDLNNKERLCSDGQALLFWNRATVFNLIFLFSPVNTTTATPVHRYVVVFVYKNICTQL